MPHDVTLITTIAAALGLALVLGVIAVRQRLPALVGYLLAGVVIGPATPGFVADVELAQQLAEIGVMLLMFGVGLHLSFDELLAVRRIERLRERGIPAVSGNATEPAVLIQAHVARAKMLVIAIPDAFGARKMIEIARTLKPNIETVVRTHSDEEAALLRADKADEVFIGEHELALGMTQHVLARVKSQAA